MRRWWHSRFKIIHIHFKKWRLLKANFLKRCAFPRLFTPPLVVPVEYFSYDDYDAGFFTENQSFQHGGLHGIKSQKDSFQKPTFQNKPLFFPCRSEPLTRTAGVFLPKLSKDWKEQGNTTTTIQEIKCKECTWKIVNKPEKTLRRTWRRPIIIL